MQQLTGLIVAKYAPSQGETIATLYQGGNNEQTAKARTRDDFQGAACFLKNLRLKATVHSLPEKSPPEFELTDDDSKRLVSSVSFEWTGDRYELALWVSKQFGPWFKVGAVSLINIRGYPYRTYNLLDLITDNLAQDLGIDDRIGYSVENAGKGLPTATDDISIFGSWVEEVYAASPVQVVGGGSDVDLNPILLRLAAVEAKNSEQSQQISQLQENPTLALPIGSIIWWHKSAVGTSLPVGWAECNGQIVNDANSPFNGLRLPAINNEGRFIRGGSSSGNTQNDAFQRHRHAAVFHGDNWRVTASTSSGTQEWYGINNPTMHSYAANNSYYGAGDAKADTSQNEPRTDTETRPINVSMVAIIRIK